MAMQGEFWKFFLTLGLGGEGVRAAADLRDGDARSSRASLDFIRGQQVHVQ